MGFFRVPVKTKCHTWVQRPSTHVIVTKYSKVAWNIGSKMRRRDIESTHILGVLRPSPPGALNYWSYIPRPFSVSSVLSVQSCSDPFSVLSVLIASVAMSILRLFYLICFVCSFGSVARLLFQVSCVFFFWFQCSVAFLGQLFLFLFGPSFVVWVWIRFTRLLCLALRHSVVGVTPSRAHARTRK